MKERKKKWKKLYRKNTENSDGKKIRIITKF